MEMLKERPDIVAIVGSVAKGQGIEQYTINKIQSNEKGEGFLGQIFMVTIQDSISGKELNIIVKAAFILEKVRKRAPIRKYFLNEICFYTEIEPEFRKLASEHGLSPTDFTPKCYKVISKHGEEKLCLENLKASNFEVFDKKKILDDEHISMIFKVYGRFHAYAFALKDQKPEEYTQFEEKLYNNYYEFMNTPNSVFKQHFIQLSKQIYQYLVPGEDDELIKKFEKYCNEGIIQIFEKVLESDEYSTILHGDCWSNNMLFKYEDGEDGKEVTDMRLLDLQITRVGSPVCDLSYCLYSGASKEVFDNLETYLKIYHNSLSETLKKLGSDPEKFFPFDVLKQQWKKYSIFGAIIAFSMLQMKWLKSTEDVVDLTDDFDDDNFPTLNIDEVMYEKRVKELLYHLLEIGVL